MHVSPLPDKISTKFQRLYLFFGSSIPLGLMKILWDQTGSGQIQDGGNQTSNACISASRQDVNEIPTAMPMFSGSSFPLGLMRILCDQTGSGQIQDGGIQTSNACVSASRQDINEIPTAMPMFSGSGFPLGLITWPCDQTGSGRIQDGGWHSLIACFSAAGQDSDNILTAEPMFFGSSIPPQLVQRLCNQTGSR